MERKFGGVEASKGAGLIGLPQPASNADGRARPARHLSLLGGKMGNASRRKDRVRRPRFVQLWHEVVDSRAWGELGYTARSIYIDLLRQYNGSNGTRLMLPKSKCHGRKGQDIHGRTYYEAIHELHRVGLIGIMLRGGLNLGGGRTCNIYALSERWHKSGTEGFQERIWPAYREGNRRREQKTPSAESAPEGGTVSEFKCRK